MKKYLSILILFILFFYHIYPQGKAVLGSSFIFLTGSLGLIFYFYNGAPFSDIKKAAYAILPIAILAILTLFLNNFSDPTWFRLFKSQIAWFFSAYLLISLFFMIHKSGDFYIILYYILAAILLQCIISVAMYMNPAINSFFNSIQMLDALGSYKREETEGARLLGYGIAFFGTGVICGFGLILLVFITMTKKLNFVQILLSSFLYAGIFYIGLLSARTTLVGAGVSLGLMIVLGLFGKGVKGKQFFMFLAIGIVLIAIGYTLCYVYFPQFADWAFEGFINYQKTGTFSTKSSDGIEGMTQMLLPWDTSGWIIGYGLIRYWGSDVGYIRLLIGAGIIGIIFYFWFLYAILKMSFSKNQSLNLMLISIFIFSLILNIKGLTDLNLFAYIFAFYFMHYKLYVLEPRLRREKYLRWLNRPKLDL